MELKSRRIWLYAVFFLPFEYFFTALIDDDGELVCRISELYTPRRRFPPRNNPIFKRSSHEANSGARLAHGN